MKLPIPPAALAQHIAVLGKTGSSKTLASIAYAAGFFDGEGFITIAAKRVVGARGLCYTMRIGASQNNPRPLHWLQVRWGGTVRAVKRKTAAHNTTYVWMCFTKQAAEFLREVLPYLQVKRQRAKLALRFQETVFNPGAGGHTEKYRELLATMKAEINYLNTHKPVRRGLIEGRAELRASEELFT